MRHAHKKDFRYVSSIVHRPRYHWFLVRVVAAIQEEETSGEANTIPIFMEEQQVSQGVAVGVDVGVQVGTDIARTKFFEGGKTTFKSTPFHA